MVCRSGPPGPETRPGPAFEQALPPTRPPPLPAYPTGPPPPRARRRGFQRVPAMGSFHAPEAARRRRAGGRRKPARAPTSRGAAARRPVLRCGRSAEKGAKMPAVSPPRGGAGGSPRDFRHPPPARAPCGPGRSLGWSREDLWCSRSRVARRVALRSGCAPRAPAAFWIAASGPGRPRPPRARAPGGARGWRPPPAVILPLPLAPAPAEPLPAPRRRPAAIPGTPFTDPAPELPPARPRPVKLPPRRRPGDPPPGSALFFGHRWVASAPRP